MVIASPFGSWLMVFSNSIVPQSSEEMFYFTTKISRIFTGFGVSQTPNENIQSKGENIMKKEKKKNGGLHKIICGIVIIIVIFCIFSSLYGDADESSMKGELSEYANYSEEELIKVLNVEKSDTGMYPNDNEINFMCGDGKIYTIMINQNHKNDAKYTLFGIALGDNETNVNDKISSQFSLIDSVSSEGGKQDLYQNTKTGCGLQIDYDSESTVTGVSYVLETES